MHLFSAVFKSLAKCSLTKSTFLQSCREIPSEKLCFSNAKVLSLKRLLIHELGASDSIENREHVMKESNCEEWAPSLRSFSRVHGIGRRAACILCDSCRTCQMPACCVRCVQILFVSYRTVPTVCRVHMPAHRLRVWVRLCRTVAQTCDICFPITARDSHPETINSIVHQGSSCPHTTCRRVVVWRHCPTQCTCS